MQAVQISYSSVAGGFDAHPWRARRPAGASLCLDPPTTSSSPSARGTPPGSIRQRSRRRLGVSSSTTLHAASSTPLGYTLTGPAADGPDFQPPPPWDYSLTVADVSVRGAPWGEQIHLLPPSIFHAVV